MQDNILYSYLDDNEKEFAACESAFDIEMDKLELAYEYTNRMQSIHMAQSELKVMNESGTFSDLEYLYTEANAEAAEKKGNIFARMFAAISKFFSNIAEKISSIFTKKAKEEVDAKIKSGEIKSTDTVQVEGDPEETLKFVDKVVGKLNTLKSKIFNKKYKVTDSDIDEADKIEKEVSDKKKALGTVVKAVTVVAVSAIGAKIGKKALDFKRVIDDEFGGGLQGYRDYKDIKKFLDDKGIDVSVHSEDKKRESLLVKVKNIFGTIAGILGSAGKGITGAFSSIAHNRAEKKEMKETKKMYKNMFDEAESKAKVESVDSNLIDFFA